MGPTQWWPGTTAHSCSTWRPGPKSDTLPPAQTAMITTAGQLLVLADDAAIHLWDPITLDDLGELATRDGGALIFPPSLAQGPDDLSWPSWTTGFGRGDTRHGAPVDLDVAEQVFGLAVSQDGRLTMINGDGMGPDDAPGHRRPQNGLLLVERTRPLHCGWNFLHHLDAKLSPAGDPARRADHQTVASASGGSRRTWSVWSQGMSGSPCSGEAIRLMLTRQPSMLPSSTQRNPPSCKPPPSGPDGRPPSAATAGWSPYTHSPKTRWPSSSSTSSMGSRSRPSQPTATSPQPRARSP